MSDQPSRESAIARLMATIEDRRRNPPPRSYTTSLFAAGPEAMGEKVLEEAREVCEAALTADTRAGRAHLVHEACDLIYHLLVVLGYHDIRLEEVESELSRRFGTSGLDEKAARQARTKPAS